jgi:isopenicillin N synthase-like dioxygenase
MPDSSAVATETLAANEIPILDLGPYFAGQPGALDAVARQLYDASTKVGFYYLKNHGVPDALVAQTFAESARFHALPLEAKRALRIDANKIGYLEVATSVTRHSALAGESKPNLYAAFCWRHDLAPDHPDVLAKKPFRAPNQWPAGLPGFRETVMAYQRAIEGLAKRILPIFARALDLPLDFFEAAFRTPLLNTQLNYYEHQDGFDGSQFGIAPHTDRGFFTVLAQASVPGLEIRTADGRWVVAPVLPGHFLVNTGDLLRFWTNELFLSTPHRVINTSRGDRHSIPLFFNPDPDTTIACLPTCATPERPAKHPPIKYVDFYSWFVKQNYPDVVAAMQQGAAPPPR